MDYQKTGSFLKSLRKEKGLTQEQLAEYFGVSCRTVSRWETGSNMPDLDMLIELADFYNLEIRELIDGEKANRDVDIQPKDTLKKVAAYAAEGEKQTHSKTVYLALSICTVILLFTKLFGGETKGLLYGLVPESICSNIMLFVYVTSAALLTAYLRAYFWQEKPSAKPVQTVGATVTAKIIRPGTHGAGRSKGGFSYVICFLTEHGQSLELYAYEIEFGSLTEGMHGTLTFRDPYFIRFEALEPLAD